MNFNQFHKWCFSSVLATTFTLSSQDAQADLVISEFLASNSGASILDENGDDSDWIEIRNTDNNSVSLNGYRLTDDDTDLSQWVFPNVSIPGNGYLLIFASSKDRTPTSGELHTNFSLSRGGEFLALVDPTGNIIDSFDPEYPSQEEDVSFGLSLDQTTQGFFASPTPGFENSTISPANVADTQFSAARGIYTDPFSLEISTVTEDATIRYTTDGSEPNLSNGITYSSPISISETTVIRAAAFKTGFTPTNVDTQSYLFLEDIVTQNANGSAPAGWPTGTVNGQVYDYGMDPDITSRFTNNEMIEALSAIPSAMITTDQDNLTDATVGIYSNPAENGRPSERSAHIEFIGGDLASSVSARCGLRIRGGFSRQVTNPKHSFRVFFRDEYGDSRLEYPMFEAEGVDTFKRLDFRTAQNYGWSRGSNPNNNTFLRDILGRDLQRESGQPYTRSRYYHLYLNGIYWGLFMTQERAEANWGESYLGGDDDEYDALKTAGRSEGYISEATDGDLNGAWRDLWDLTQAQGDSPTTARYLQMQGLNSAGELDPNIPQLLDVDNLIDYMMILGYTGAYDNSLSAFVGAANNWYSVRNAVRNDRGFIHLMHDGEHSMGVGGRWANNNDRINTTDGFNRRDNFDHSNPQFFHVELAESTPEYRLRFADRAHAALFNDGYLTREKVIQTLEKRREIVDQVIIAESARWGDAQRNDPADKENWEGAVDDLIATIDTRSEVFLGHLREGNLYPDTDAPTFTPFASLVEPGTSINIDAPEGTIYYTTDGSDPRLSNGTVSPNAHPMDPASQTTLISQNSVWAYDDTGADLGSSDIVVGSSGYSILNWKHLDFDDSSWESGPAVLGFGQLGNSIIAPIATEIGLDSGPNNSNPRTSYLRKEFTVNDLSLIGSLRATLLADDAVIIYLNGEEVYRENLNTGQTVNFDTLANNAVPGNSESDYQEIPISLSSLVEGNNIITVELHQASDTSSDLGFDLTLSAGSNQGLTIDSPTYLSSRALNNGEWSAIVTQYYSIGKTPQIGDLVISEIHYHPADPTSSAELAISDDDSDYEFIEIANISGKVLELQNSSLGEQVIGDHLEGVRFEFEDGFILFPGERVLVVSNEAAFLTRYPAVNPDRIAGEYNGGLGNSGEWLLLRNSEGTILSSFRYNDNDPWPAGADGDGDSIQFTRLFSGANFGDPLTVGAAAGNATPGEDGKAPFAGITDVDADGDGTVALIEYFAGTSDSSAASNFFPQIWQDTNSGVNTLRYSYVRDPDAINVGWVFEQSLDLSTWSEPTTQPTLVERNLRSDGLVEEVYEFDISTAGVRPFIRQNIDLTE